MAQAVVKLILLGTSGCHLCDLARDQWLSWLSNSGPFGQFVQWREQDIADSDELIECYGVRIPVLWLPDCKAELAWPFDQASIDRFIRTHVALT